MIATRPQGLVLFELTREECVHKRQNGRLAAEILVQWQTALDGEIFAHRVEDAGIRPSKAVNRLFRVPNDEQLSVREAVSHQRSHDFGLDRIGVLELVD